VADVVRVAVLLTPAFEAVMVVEPMVVAGNVGIAKVVLVAPAGTVVLDGAVARVTTELVRVTTVPPEGAAALRVTVPVTAIPPTTLAWFTETEVRLAANADDGSSRNEARSQAVRAISSSLSTCPPFGGSIGVSVGSTSSHLIEWLRKGRFDPGVRKTTLSVLRAVRRPSNLRETAET
jgi:hypothetical protein